MKTHATRPAYRGEAGTFSFQHRASIRLRLRPATLVGNGLLVLLLSVGWYAGLRVLSVGWAYLLSAWNTVAGFGGQVVMVHYGVDSMVPFAVPYLSLPAGPPTAEAIVAAAFGVLAFFLVSYVVPQRFTPLIYFLRAVAFLLATSVVYFFFTPDTFPYTLDDYARGMMITATLITCLVPLVYGVTYFLLDVSLMQKLGLTAITFVAFALIIPHQYLLHALLIHHGSLMVMAPIYLLFGLPLNVLVFVSLYAWGMSWKGKVLSPEPLSYA